MAGSIRHPRRPREGTVRIGHTARITVITGIPLLAEYLVRCCCIQIRHCPQILFAVR
jgi:hypothetical protein